MQNKEKKPNPKRRSQKLDWILLALCLLSAALAFFLCYRMSVLPTRYLTILGLILVIAVLVSFLLCLCRLRRTGRWIRRAFMIILCGVFCFGAYTANSVHSTFSTITRNDPSIVKVSVVTLADSDIAAVEDLSGKTVAVQNGMDKDNADFAREQLDQEASNITYEEVLDYLTMYNELTDGTVDAMIITDSSVSLLEDQHSDIRSQIKTIATYERENESVNTATTDKDLRSDPFVVYLGGMDEGTDPSIDSKCDVNILLMVNPKINKITTISIPRDSYVPNPALNYGSDKLTHLGNNGPENSIAGIEEFTGINIDFYAKVNFFSVIEIVDAIGGVDVDVQLDFCEQDENRNKDAEHQICLAKGEQHLNGQEALAYSRHRKTASWGTQGREKAQTQIIEAIINKLTSVEGAANVNSVMSIAQQYISTNIPMDSLTSFLSYQLDHLKPWTVEGITLTDGVDGYYTTVSIPSIPLSCHLLTQEDARIINAVYNSMYETPDMSEFTFDLNDLSFSDVEIQDSEYMIWAEDAASLNSSAVYFGLSEPSIQQQYTPEYEEVPQETTDQIQDSDPIVQDPQEDVPEEPTEPVVPEDPSTEEPGSGDEGGSTTPPSTGGGDQGSGSGGDTGDGSGSGDGSGETQPPEVPAQ